MRSIFGKILLWFTGMLVLAVVSFFAVSVLVAPRRTDDRFAGTIALQLDGARLAYEWGGRAELAAFFGRMARQFPGQAYLCDGKGRDLLTGDDRSSLLASAHVPGTHPRGDAPLILTRASEDGRYRIVVVPQPRPDMLTPLPYYAWIPIAIGILCYVLALHLAAPARKLRAIVDRFGRGDLAVRAGFTQKDEFGDLARAFDLMAERIERLVEEQRRLLQDVSHELRSPLTRLGYAIALARTSEDREQGLARIEKDVGRLANLVSGLLEATRGDGERLADTRDVPLDVLVREVADDCRMEADARSCRVALGPMNPVSVRGAGELLRRAVENVLRNAIAHAPAGTTVDVSVQAAAGMAAVSVRDLGPGVPEDQLEAIFRPFFRVEGHRARDAGGVGLGLAIAQRAVVLHQGRISARNAHPGLEVRIDLPA
jgi:signal transduction histidine kinase